MVGAVAVLVLIVATVLEATVPEQQFIWTIWWASILMIITGLALVFVSA